MRNEAKMGRKAAAVAAAAVARGGRVLSTVAAAAVFVGSTVVMIGTLKRLVIEEGWGWGGVPRLSSR